MKKDVENMMQPDRVAEAVTYLADRTETMNLRFLPLVYHLGLLCHS